MNYVLRAMCYVLVRGVMCYVLTEFALMIQGSEKVAQPKATQPSPTYKCFMFAIPLVLPAVEGGSWVAGGRERTPGGSLSKCVS
jgi:hypothetical protein